MSKHLSQPWIPLHIHKWLEGSTREELQHDERAIFSDLLCLASKNGGYIGANVDDGFPYSNSRLSKILDAPVELIERTLEKCIDTGKIERLKNGILRIVKWEDYQLSDRWIRKLNSAKTEHSSEKPEHYSAKEEPRGEDIDTDKDIKKDKEKEVRVLKEHPYFSLALRILSNAEKNNPLMTTKTSYQNKIRPKKLGKIVDDLRLLIEEDLKAMPREDAIIYVNKLLDWALNHEFWSKQVESGKALRRGFAGETKLITQYNDAQQGKKRDLRRGIALPSEEKKDG